MLDWIFEGIANWVASIMTQLMDAVSGLFLDALGTDMTAMEEYFPFVVSAYNIIQYTAWAILFLTVYGSSSGHSAARSLKPKIRGTC